MTSISLNQEFDALVKATLAEKQLISNDNQNDSGKENIPPEITDESAKSPNFFHNNKPSDKRNHREHTTTPIKSRNFPSNNSYIGINEKDFYNQNFIFDIYLFMI